MILKVKMAGKIESIYDPVSESFIAESKDGIFDVPEEIGRKMIDLGYEPIETIEPMKSAVAIPEEKEPEIEKIEEPKKKMGRPRK